VLWRKVAVPAQETTQQTAVCVNFVGRKGNDTVRTLTKEQVQRLRPDQQVAIATMEAESVRAKQQLIDRAGPSRTRDAVTGLLAGAALGLAIFSFVQPRALAFSIISLVALVNVHIVGINRRLDALLQLLHPDLSVLAEAEQQDAQHAASPNSGPVKPSADSGVSDRPPR
jgi:hypothetical protein